MYSVTGREVTSATVAAVLTILGYSLYDTIIVFDRVRENERLLRRHTYGQIVNISLWETLTRSLNTSIITLLPIASLFMFGGDTLKDFAFALLIGIISGAYSSFFVASPLLVLLKRREPEFAKRQGSDELPAIFLRSKAAPAPAAATPAPAGAAAAAAPAPVVAGSNGAAKAPTATEDRIQAAAPAAATASAAARTSRDAVRAQRIARWTARAPGTRNCLASSDSKVPAAQRPELPGPTISAYAGGDLPGPYGSGVRLVVDPCPFEASEHLRRELGVSRVMADVLVRRGLGDAAEAREFLALRGPQHDPLELGDMAAACDVIEAAIADGRKIVVHGDYDVDGICATAVATAVIAALGGTVEPFLPSRFDEGYGLAIETVERLAAEGCGLLVTVDCGITAVDAAARAAELGLALVITDHHRPGDELPGCPRGRAARPRRLPRRPLRHRRGLEARRGARRPRRRRPRHRRARARPGGARNRRRHRAAEGENRALVRSGLEALRRTRRPGLRRADARRPLRAARASARPRSGSGSAPRINAAGRLGHPREALELLTTTDERRARELADVLDARNRERQAVEGEILRDALAMVEALPDERRAQRGLCWRRPTGTSAWSASSPPASPSGCGGRPC